MISTTTLTVDDVEGSPSISFSVVMPVYNRENLIEEAIESILSQTMTPCELIVVDDGSTDSTAELVQRQRGVKLLQQPNKGCAAARNRGISIATGDFIVFFDSDDLMYPDALSRLQKVVLENPTSKIFALSRVDFEGRPPNRDSSDSRKRLDTRTTCYDDILDARRSHWNLRASSGERTPSSVWWLC